MKRITWIIILFVLFLVGSMAPIGQTSTAAKIPVSASDTFCPLPFCDPPVGAILDVGTVRCPGNEPTGNPLVPCPPGSRTHARGFTFTSRMQGDALLTGVATIVTNFNLDAEFTGPVWGTVSIALDAGGTWEGTYQGKTSVEDGQGVLVLNSKSHGSGGAIEGMQLKFTEVIVSASPLLIPYTGTINGRILDPHSK